MINMRRIMALQPFFWLFLRQNSFGHSVFFFGANNVMFKLFGRNVLCGKLHPFHRFLAIKIHPKDWDDIEGRNKLKDRHRKKTLPSSRWFSNQIVYPGEKRRPSVFLKTPGQKVVCFCTGFFFWEAIKHRVAGFRKKKTSHPQN